MNKKEIDESRWAGYSLETSDVSEEVVEECLSVLNYLDSKKSDVVNWEERAEMDRVTRSHGSINNSELLTDEQEITAPDKKFSANEKENELMSGLADIMNQLEDTDGSK